MKAVIISTVNWLFGLVMISLVVVGVAFSSFVVWDYNYSEQAQKDKIREIYRQLIAQTGQSQDALPLVISDEMIDNAYNDGTQIVYYMGLYSHARSWDEVAMVLSHEIAHGMLWHLRMDDSKLTSNDIAVLEGNADKMGALYMIKAGYDVCEGRNLFKYWGEENGDALGQDHPPYSYRYAQLNINCE